MKKFLWILPILIVAHFARLILDAGAFRKIENHGMESCHSIGEIPGAEDLEGSKSLKLIFVSSDHRPEKGETTPSGAIFAFAPGSAQAPKQVSQALPFPFHPHGIGLWEKDGLVRLFAVNHRAREDSIEIFRWQRDHLEFEKSLVDPSLVAANDILAKGPESFYVSLDHGSANHLAQQIEHFTRFGRGALSFYDGQRFRIAVPRLFFANGLAEAPGDHELFVAEMLGKRIQVYNDSAPANPVYLRTIELPSAPDNIKIDGKGMLWAGTHPKLFTLKKHSEDHSQPSPTLILKVASKGAGPAEEIFSDDGQKLSASSVALPWEGKIYLGSIYDQKIMECNGP